MPSVADLKNIIAKSPIEPKPVVESLFYVYDWKAFIVDHLRPMKYNTMHSNYHSFQLLKESEGVKLRCKRYPHDKVYGPPSGIKLVSNSIDFIPVGSADFRIESLQLDKLFRSLEEYFL